MPFSPFRLLRTILVGATILGLASGAHLLGGGALPAPAIMAAILALHILCSSIATKFRLTPAVMVALLASSQLVLHQGFETLSHGIAPIAAPGTEALDQHVMSAEAHASAVMSAASMAGAPGMAVLGHAAHMSGWMLVAHIAATLVAAGLLAYGENALWSLAGWLRPLYERAAAVLLPPTHSPRPGIISHPLPCIPWRNQRPDTRRGPPLSAVVPA
ncbi:hypothetical protein [Arthrobacter sp.]|uniref:hypothetical protein n=1 Tax=Arthrobacter sp. TaxID=1667 RepID=UPI0026DFEA9B|nr:hypothetical protein [Arthrobacter sp.]MDO5754398.1 hypothetical protein [Arthrobacter sp.]